MFANHFDILPSYLKIHVITSRLWIIVQNMNDELLLFIFTVNYKLKLHLVFSDWFRIIYLPVFEVSTIQYLQYLPVFTVVWVSNFLKLVFLLVMLTSCKVKVLRSISISKKKCNVRVFTCHEVFLPFKTS